MPLHRKTGVTVTVVHAPWKICGSFEIAAAWDTGDCHPSFNRPIYNRRQDAILPYFLVAGAAGAPGNSRAVLMLSSFGKFLSRYALPSLLIRSWSGVWS